MKLGTLLGQFSTSAEKKTPENVDKMGGTDQAHNNILNVVVMELSQLYMCIKAWIVITMKTTLTYGIHDGGNCVIIFAGIYSESGH